MDKHWIVCSAEGWPLLGELNSAPIIHPSQEKADHAAHVAAQKCPGAQYFVLEAISMTSAEAKRPVKKALGEGD